MDKPFGRRRPRGDRCQSARAALAIDKPTRCHSRIDRWAYVTAATVSVRFTQLEYGDRAWRLGPGQCDKDLPITSWRYRPLVDVDARRWYKVA